MRQRLISTAVLACLAVGLAPGAALAASRPAVHAGVKASAHAKVSPTPYLGRGARGSAVVRVQHILHVRATGVLDKATMAAVVKFQRAHHLRATGAVDARTWAPLLVLEKQEAAAAKAAAARQLAAARQEYAGTTAYVSEYAAKNRPFLASYAQNGVTLVPADMATLTANINRVAAGIAKDNSIAAHASTAAQVRAAIANLDVLLGATDVINAQIQNADLHQDAAGVAAETVKNLDAMAAQALAAGYPAPDPTAAANARAAVVAASAAFYPVDYPRVDALLKLDPFSAGAEAKVTAFRDAPQTPQEAAAENAWNTYGQLLMGGVA